MDENRREQEPVELARPDEAVKDLEPDEEEREEVKGGATLSDISFTKYTDKSSPNLSL